MEVSWENGTVENLTAKGWQSLVDATQYTMENKASFIALAGMNSHRALLDSTGVNNVMRWWL